MNNFLKGALIAAVSGFVGFQIGRFNIVLKVCKVLDKANKGDEACQHTIDRATSLGSDLNRKD